MNQGVKIQPTRHEEYVIQQSMVKKIKINLKRLESDMELMELVFKELIVIQQIYFNQKNNSNNFVLTICKYLISRIENPKASKILYEIVNNPKLEIDNIKVELLEKNMDNDEFNEIFDDDRKIIPEKLKSKCKKI